MLTHARRSQQLILSLFCFFVLFFLQINPKPRHGGIRTHGRTPKTISINSSIRGLPLVHRGDRLYIKIYPVKTLVYAEQISSANSFPRRVRGGAAVLLRLAAEAWLHTMAVNLYGGFGRGASS